MTPRDINAQNSGSGGSMARMSRPIIRMTMTGNIPVALDADGPGR